jgi:hypothetical protein
MAHDLNEVRPIGGLNLDDNARNVPRTDYVNARNIRNAINALNRGGNLTNIRGNLAPSKYTLPYNANIFPTGTNKVIGSVEDTKYSTVLFFVWNSLGKHQILRYYRNLTSPQNPYGEVQQVIQYDFGWTKTTEINSGNIVYGVTETGDADEETGDLLYWCDPVPKKINLTKANVCTKQKSWDLFLPQTCDLATIVLFTFKNFSGITVYSIGELLTDPTDRQAIITDIAANMNADTTSPVTAEACDCRLVLTEKTAGNLWTIETDSDQILISPKNWYGGTLIDRFFDRCKWQPLNAPQPTFERDLNYEPNYVQRKVFQFRLEYDYDDLERSSLGVWSQIPINNLGCDGSSDKSYNYIDVDFNDTLIPLATTLVLLKRVRLIARELNTGLDRAVISLEPCDFLDYRDGAWYCHFNFYNDIISSAIDAATAAKLFDNVPLETNDERFVKNRIVEGGILEGYNAPECVDASFQIDFADNPNPPLRKVTVRFRVMTWWLLTTYVTPPPSGGLIQQPNFYNTFPLDAIDKFPYWIGDATLNQKILRGGIFSDGAAEVDAVPNAYYGGVGTGDGGFRARPGMLDVFQQQTPEKGFPCYLAGTQYLGVSRQIQTGLPTTGSNVLDVSSQDYVDDIKTYLDGGGDLYSEVTFLVPDGNYVARVPSHWGSFGDKLSKGFAYNFEGGTQYQKTSANVWGVFDADKDMDVTGWLKQKEIHFTVNGADIAHAGTFVIADLSAPFDLPAVKGGSLSAGIWQPISCYLYDSNGNTNPNSVEFIGIPVEKTIVQYNKFFYTDTAPPFKWGEAAVTDHNGYWFGIYGVSEFGVVPSSTPQDAVSLFDIIALQVNAETIYDSTIIYTGTLTEFYTKSLVQVVYSGNILLATAPLVFGVIATNTANARLNCSTIITGSILNQTGTGVADVAVIYENGAVVFSAVDGSYTMAAWGDIVTANLGIFATADPIAASSSRTVDDIILTASVFCNITFPTGSIFNIAIDPFGTNGTDTPPPYSPTAVFVVANVVVDEGNNPTIKALKRGGNVTYGIRAYDNAGRLCSVVEAIDLYIPFITEDIGKYSIQDFSGAIYPTSTFKYGKPTVKWILANTTVFPSWVASIQWMRTKDSIYGRYLQWIANEVVYIASLATAGIPEIRTSFQNGDATAIKISLSNVVTYASQNNNSQVGYSYQAGDRVRIMYDRSLNPINGLNDFEVTGYEIDTQNIIIKPEGFDQEILSGSVFEVFNPKSLATEDSQILYEVGEVVKVNNGIPASFSGVFSNGDTYWRGRYITVNDSITGYITTATTVIEDASVSDFYPSLAQDIGRPGIIDPAFKQVYAPTKMRCSNPFLPSTAINGLSSFEELNQIELDRSNGQIERLLQKENTVISVTSEREISTYIEVVSFQQADTGSGVLAVANQYFGTQYPHAKRLGTDLPSTVLINDGQAFGFQSKRGEAWRYQGDGELSISDAKMVNYFKQLEQDGVSKAHAFYDRFHKEYGITVWREYQERSTIVSFGGGAITVEFEGDAPIIGEDVTIQYLTGAGAGTWLSTTGAVIGAGLDNIIRISVSGVSFSQGQQVNITYSLPETVVFFNGNTGTTKDRWVRFDDRCPENWQQCGSELVSFKNGRVWLENVNPICNNFYGIQYNSKISPVFNENPDDIKVFNALWMSQKQADNGCDWFSSLITNTIGQLSRLNKNNWRKRESDWYIDLKRDLTDTTVANPIINGRRLRDTDLTVELTNDGTGEFNLYSFRMNWTTSARTEK